LVELLEDPGKDFVLDFENAEQERRFLLGRSEYATSVIHEYEICGVIDDFTNDTSFEGVPILRSSAVPKSGLVLSASMLRPHSAKRLLDSLGIRNLDYFAFISQSSKPLKRVCFWDEFKLDYTKNLKRFLAVRDQLCDQESIRTWDSIISFRLTYQIKYTEEFKFDQVNQYFEPFLGIPKNGAVFYDVGCFDGDTSEQFAQRFEGYQTIFGFEPDPTNAVKALDRFKGEEKFKLVNFGLSDSNQKVRFNSNQGSSSHQSSSGDISIELIALDELDLAPPTFIKMDIEGGEIDAIRGAQQTIRKFNPVIAVSVYHKHDDFYTIPELILSINSNYKLYLRHYTEGIDETVMFFIPNVMLP